MCGVPIDNNQFRKGYRFELQHRQLNSIIWLIRFSQFIGAAPVNLNFDPNNTVLKNINRSSFNFKEILHHLWCVLLVGGICFCMYSRSAEAFAREYSVSTMLDPVEYLFSLAKCLVVMIGCYYQRKKYAKYFLDIIDIDIRIQRNGGIAFRSTLRQFCWRIGLAWIVFNVMCIVLDIIFRNGIVYNIMRSLFVYLIPNVIFSAAILQYVCLLYALRQRFDQINYVLKRLLNEMDDRGSRKSASESIASSSLAVMSMSDDEIANVNRVKVKGKRKLKGVVKVPIPQILDSLRMIFADLIDLNSRIGDTFGLLVMLVATAAFITICSQMFIFYRFARGVEVLNILRTMYCAMWVFLHGARLWLILYINSMIENEVC